MADLEEQCVDELIEICMTRDHYPQRCAAELKKCIRLKNEISMIQVTMQPDIVEFPSFTEEQREFFDIKIPPICLGGEVMNDKLKVILDKVDSLKAVTHQIEAERNSSFIKKLK